MRHKAVGKQAYEGLARIWGRHLIYDQNCSRLDLNCTLVCKPDGHPFQLGKHPAPRPPKGAPPVFERILDDGHWPDTHSYAEDDLSGEYNLLERVAIHLPGSQYFLMEGLKRAALEQRLFLPEIQSDIAHTLSHFGLERMHPMVAEIVVGTIATTFSDDRWTKLFVPHWRRLASFDEPLHLQLLMLLWMETRCYDVPQAFKALPDYARVAWTRFLRRPEFRAHRYWQVDALDVCRDLMAFVGHARGGLQFDRIPMKPVNFYTPNCCIWKPSEAGLAAQKRLIAHRWELFNRGIQMMDQRQGLDRWRPDLAPPGVEADIHQMVQGVIDAEEAFTTWSLAWSARPKVPTRLQKGEAPTQRKKSKNKSKSKNKRASGSAAGRRKPPATQTS